MNTIRRVLPIGRHNLHRSKSGRLGYTLVELAVVAVLGAVLIAIAARWVGQLGQVALQQVAGGVQANVIVASDRLEDDLTAAVHCDPWNLDSPIAEVTPSSLYLFVDANGDGTPTFVRWSVNLETGLLTRAEGAAGEACSQPTLPTGVALIESVATGTAETPLFTPAVGGVLATSASDWGICTNSIEARCQIDAVQVDLTVLDGGTPITVTHHFPVGTR